MGTDKRTRQKANRDAKRAAEAAQAARKRRAVFIRNALLMAIGIVIVGVLLSLNGCSSDKKTAATTTTAATPAGVKAEYGTAACPPASGAERKIDFTAAPKKCIDPSKTYTATFDTTEGTVSVTLDTTKTPVTTNNFVVLARWHFFDGTKIFRTEANTGIIQGGSPKTQSNTDPGPGYTIPDEALPFTSKDYGPGTLAMARTSAPNSGGGQFFLLANEGARYLGDQAQLGPDAGSYVVFGKATEGLDVLAKIAAADTGDGQGTPSREITINKVTITES